MQVINNDHNFKILVKLSEKQDEINDLTYILSKSDISNIKENLENLNKKLYDLRNFKFANPIKFA